MRRLRPDGIDVRQRLRERIAGVHPVDRHRIEQAQLVEHGPHGQTVTPPGELEGDALVGLHGIRDDFLVDVHQNATSPIPAIEPMPPIMPDELDALACCWALHALSWLPYCWFRMLA